MQTLDGRKCGDLRGRQASGKHFTIACVLGSAGNSAGSEVQKRWQILQDARKPLEVVRGMQSKLEAGVVSGMVCVATVLARCKSQTCVI
jgi:hypothetical protein